MFNAVLPNPARSSAASTLAAAVVLVAWFATVTWLGASGALLRPPGTPPLPILVTVALPVVIFAVLFGWSRAFRDFVLSKDLRLVTALQAWRFGGFAFLALYAYGVLPRIFAYPAGLGDMAIAAVAPWMALRLGQDPGFATSKGFRAWNWLGILDLVVAVSIGGLSSMLVAGSPSEVTTAPMAQLPLVLIPAYFVPLFIILHIAALYRTRARS